MLKKVIKRDGKQQVYMREKVHTAVLKAFKSCKQEPTEKFIEQLNEELAKVENADNLWESHYNELLSPTIDLYPDFVKERIYTKGRATDICMYGVGWVCFKGSCDYIDIRYPKGVKVKVRKAML